MANIHVHNTRILRFLIVLSTVVLTIFIYASYYSNTALTPPHMHTGAMPPAPAAAALTGEQAPNMSRAGAGGAVFISAYGGSAVNASYLAKVNKKSAASALLKRPTHHREPTIDEDANDRGGGPGNGLDDVPDEQASELNNDLLEEQYAQNVEDALGNNNNNTAASATQSQQKQQQQPQQQKAQAPEQQQQIQIIDNNNLNKILDSDVLIPTSNLQKFIENADKILKNITVTSTPVANKTVSDSVSQKVEAVVVEEQPKQQQQQADKFVGETDIDEGDAPAPPSVVMTIKRGGGSPAMAAALAAAAVTKAISGKTKTTPKNNSTGVSNAPAVSSNVILTQRIYESGHLNEEIDIEELCPKQGNDLKLLILITSAPSHTEARLSIRQTWGHYTMRRDVAMAFVLGRSSNLSLNAAMTEENYMYGDLIRGNFMDSYNNLTLKTISSLEWVDNHCKHAKYLLKTDDDMFINVPKLLAFLDKHAKETHVIYGRLAKKWKPIRSKKSKYYVSTDQFSSNVFPPFTTGPAYVLSHDVIHDLYVHSLQQVYLKLEDVFLTGVVAQQLNIKRVHVNEFLNRRIPFNPCNIRKSISVHMIKSNEQFDLWKKLLDQTSKCK